MPKLQSSIFFIEDSGFRKAHTPLRGNFHYILGSSLVNGLGINNRLPAAELVPVRLALWSTAARRRSRLRQFRNRQEPLSLPKGGSLDWTALDHQDRNSGSRERRQAAVLHSRFLKTPSGGEGARTPDLRLAKPALFQTELHPQKLGGPE